MQSLFELKTKLTVDMSVFEQMKKTAEIELSKAEAGQYTQAMVFLSLAKLSGDESDYTRQLSVGRAREIIETNAASDEDFLDAGEFAEFS